MEKEEAGTPDFSTTNIFFKEIPIPISEFQSKIKNNPCYLQKIPFNSESLFSAESVGKRLGGIRKRLVARASYSISSVQS